MDNTISENSIVSRENGNAFVVQPEYGHVSVKKKKKTLDNSAYYLSDEEIKKLLNASKRLQDRVIIELGVFCGLRRDEIVSLAGRDVDLEHNVLHLKKTKGLRERDVPVLPEVAQNLRYLLEGRKDGYLITNPKGTRFSIRHVNYLVEEIGKRAGIMHPADPEKNIHPHLLRHTFARRYLKNGGRMEVLQKLMGHSSITTTIGIYGSPSLENIKEDYYKTVKTI